MPRPLLYGLLLLNFLAPSKVEALGISTNLPAGWVSQGCITEASGVRALAGSSYTSSNAMTEESCIAFCATNYYVLAGVEYASQCYCGNSTSTGSVAAPSTDCNKACTGNSAELCGAGNRLNLFNNTAVKPPPPPSVNPGPPGWQSMGCYTDSGNPRTLAFAAQVPGGSATMTVALCTSACQQNGYTYAGVEYAGECYCGNTITSGTPATSGCAMPCKGNSSEYCGGSSRLNLYQVSVSNAGSSSISSLSSASSSSSSSSSIISSSTSSSTSSSISSSTSSSTSSSSSIPITSSTTSTSSTSTSSISSPTVSPTGNSKFPPGWSYYGCWLDNAHGRVMANQLPDNKTLTQEGCAYSCYNQGYQVAGMEYGVQCFCANMLIQGATQVADSQCSTNCGGDATEKCGAGSRLSVFSNTTLTVIPVASAKQTYGNWQYQGCLTEGSSSKVFPNKITFPTNNSASTCLDTCAMYGYGAGGMEYGTECYCGDSSDVLNAVGATWRPDSECSFACPGDPASLCGAGNRLNIYYYQGYLNKFNYASGNAAGSYSLLIGGVVVPLMVTPGINGKITFLEKHGTGAANSTGAYELDPSQIGNFSAAWRTMVGVKTDIFCSAGLVLPDRGGRQLTIGGWSGTSTYGVRLYYPDGAPGVASKNDWQENVAHLSLQQGRWYPSSLIMANGSILVVGGEVGSNSAPDPTLEILPNPPGGRYLFMEWLNRTDPNNLYPFLHVLPSGNIFVAYYNEARILNPATFDTIKVMPMIPGGIQGYIGGRTYPFEGTSFLLPQYAPYTDPLTVVLCGGGGAGPYNPIDNCVSIQPEVANPQWVIERMPSRRVMPCVAPLPDGTYLIANGAHQGVAGFGLASDPNLNAILYDPSQPVNYRFTVMANTSVARLYHSEAVLMQDARILISGSDPQDNTHPEEYRVEVFTPPYRLSAASIPSFTITNANRDWTYGQQYTFTVNIPSGQTPRVSLMGAVSSTHGNSFGGRTIFPAFSCAGNTCTVTAPPNAFVAPPGWFQMFVLDGPTPSQSIFVRIGGDPAGLGNWPNYPEFTLPGVGPAFS